MADNAGDDSQSHAALFINTGNDKTDIVLLSWTAAIIAGMGDGVDAVGQPDIHHALVDISNRAGVFALKPAQAEIILPGIGYAAQVRLDGNMLNILPVDAENTHQHLVAHRKRSRASPIQSQDKSRAITEHSTPNASIRMAFSAVAITRAWIIRPS